MVQVTLVANDAISADSKGSFDWMLEALSSVGAEVVMFAITFIVYLSFRSARVQSARPRAKTEGQQRMPPWASKNQHGTRRKETSLPKLAAVGLETTRATSVSKCVEEIRISAKNKELSGVIAAFENHMRSGGAATSLLHKTIMDACVECGDVNKAAAYFDKAKREGLVDVVCYNIMMKGRLLAGDIKRAENLLVDLERAALKPSHASFHGLLNYRVQNGDFRRAWCIIEQMQAADLSPNSCTCSILLKGISTPGHAADLQRIWSFADSLHNDIDRQLLGALVEGCLRTKQGDLGLKAMRKARESTTADLLLFAPAYGSLIKFFGKANDVTRIWEVWREMQNHGVKPSAVTLGCMTEALVANHCSMDAWKLVRSAWKDEDQRPLVNTVTYSTLLKGFAHDPHQVHILYKEMRDCGIECNAVTYNTMLNVLIQSGDMSLIPSILEDMANAIPPVDPDVVTYATLIKGYCASGDVERAMKLFEDMKASKNIAPDDVMYHCLLDGFAKAQRVGDALRLYDDMVASNISPSNFTLSIMVKLLGRSKRLQQALSLVEQVSKEHGVQPNIQVYTCLMQACFQNKQVAQAVALLDRMIAEGITPDERTYSALVQGCLAAGPGQKDKAVGLALRAFEGSRPAGIDAKVLSTLVAKIGKESEPARKILAAAQKPRQLGASGRKRQ
jgi:pentatricopeptide repeat protein